MKLKEESEKPGLKLNIQKTKIMASSPITSWQIDGETVETVADFIFLGSKITADSYCSHEIKRHLLLGRKAMTVQFSCSVVSDSLRPHGLQHTGFPVHHQLLELAQTHVHQVGDAIHHLILGRPLLLLPPIPLSIRSFPMVNSSHEVAKVFEFQLQHQSFQWTPRTDLL